MIAFSTGMVINMAVMSQLAFSLVETTVSRFLTKSSPVLQACMVLPTSGWSADARNWAMWYDILLMLETIGRRAGVSFLCIFGSPQNFRVFSEFVYGIFLGVIDPKSTCPVSKVLMVCIDLGSETLSFLIHTIKTFVVCIKVTKVCSAPMVQNLISLFLQVGIGSFFRTSYVHRLVCNKRESNLFP